MKIGVGGKMKVGDGIDGGLSSDGGEKYSGGG